MEDPVVEGNCRATTQSCAPGEDSLLVRSQEDSEGPVILGKVCVGGGGGGGGFLFFYFLFLVVGGGG